MRTSLFLLLAGLSISFLMVPVWSQNSGDCSQATNCDHCMRLGPMCAWCYSSNYKDINIGTGYRCAPVSILKVRGCPVKEITWENSTIDSTPKSDDFHLSMKNVKATLRPGDTKEILFQYVPIKNFPVDMYLLTDVSFTMKKHIKTVSESAQRISEAMLKITSAFRFGFGTFVDKPVVPYVSPDIEFIKNPCSRATTGKCIPPYLYKHVLSITPDMDQFSKATTNPPPSGNVDAPEGGLDALLQVAYCSKQVGWNPSARKIVLLASDAASHLAGDGRFAGLIEPPPRSCQITKAFDRFSEDQLEFIGWHNATHTDYPSVGEISRVLTETDTSIIFLTTEKYLSVYQSLAENLPSSSVGELSDTSNVVQLLTENYNKIASKVLLQIGGKDQSVDLSLWTRCNGEMEYTRKDTCLKNPQNGVVDYKLKVTVKKCFSGTKNLKVGIAGISGEAQIEVSSKCKCSECNIPRQINSTNCKNHGSFWCGSCQCDAGYSGDFCECDKKSSSASQKEQKQRCVKQGETEICSGRGRCSCGICICGQADYSGKFCECDSQACPRASDDNVVCGGPSRGICQCDATCKCKPGYSTKACDCLTDGDENCRSSKNASEPLCSGNGQCDCGVCFCEGDSFGPLCNEIRGGEGAYCSDKTLQACILCLHRQKTGDGQMDCQAKCNATNLESPDVKMVDSTDTSDGSNLCITYDDKECRVFWTYIQQRRITRKRTIVVTIQSASHCPTQIKIWVIILGVILGIVLIGVILLCIWKLVITIDDRRELAKFQKESENAKWEMEENPIFKAPVTTVNNPMYTGAID